MKPAIPQLKSLNPSVKKMYNVLARGMRLLDSKNNALTKVAKKRSTRLKATDNNNLI